MTWEKSRKEGKVGAGEGKGRRAVGRVRGARRQDVLLWSSNALQQVGVAVGASAAVTQHSDARPPSHGTAVAYSALGATGTC